MSKSWKVVDEHYYEKFRIFSAKRSKRVNPRTGKSFDFFLMEGLDWVSIIPITKDKEVVLVRQYRHGSESFTLETPGGTLEPEDISPQERAIIELKEETGYSIKRVEHLGTVHANPAMQSMRMHFFVGYDAEVVQEQELDPGEDITVIKRPLEEVLTSLGKGEYSHGLIVAGFGLYLRNHITSQFGT